ncbi:hypothetical protein J6590_027054 [Homalodisca vitripennis]|nr:hypothetical protein J6590_027054 [Homalodisca vitripennis]
MKVCRRKLVWSGKGGRTSTDSNTEHVGRCAALYQSLGAKGIFRGKLKLRTVYKAICEIYGDILVTGFTFNACRAIYMDELGANCFDLWEACIIRGGMRCAQRHATPGSLQIRAQLTESNLEVQNNI